MLSSLHQTDGFFSSLLFVADILIVAFIIYRVILLINRTRAVQLLIGAGVILLLDVIARRLELVTLSWLITNVSSYLVFALIVLLQPELRRLFSEIGQMPIFQWIGRHEATRLDPISDAVVQMARTKTGSIICILREIKPEAIIEKAVRLDSLITSELLLTIFHKDTALHDGAVFVEGDRILAASCYLPLSDNLNILKRTHGARHRAALGMSEESDAVIVVTSEETGKISLLFGGEMLAAVKFGELKPLLALLLSGRVRSLQELDFNSQESLSKSTSKRRSS